MDTPVTITSFLPPPERLGSGTVACRQSASSPYECLRQIAMYLGQCQAPWCNRETSSRNIVSYCEASECYSDCCIAIAVEDVFYFLAHICSSYSLLHQRNWTTGDQVPVTSGRMPLVRCPSLEAIVEEASSPRAAAALSPRKKSCIDSMHLFPSWKEKFSPPWQRALTKVLALVHLLREPGVPSEELPQLPLIPMHPSRRLEFCDRKHRNGKALEKEWKKWLKLPLSIPKKPDEPQMYTKQEKYFFSYLLSKRIEISNVKYLDAEQRSFRKLNIDANGVCSTIKDKVLHTQDDAQPHTCVWAANGHIYIGLYEEGFSHHSDNMAGAPVIFAGTIVFNREGRPAKFTDKSGHYRGSELALIEFIYELKKRGVSVDHVPVILDCVKEPFTVLRYTSGGALLELREQLYELRLEGRIPENATPEESLEFVRSKVAGRISAETPLDEALQIIRVHLANEESKRIIFALKKAYVKKNAPLEASPEELEEFVRSFKAERISLDAPPEEAMRIVRAQLASEEAEHIIHALKKTRADREKPLSVSPEELRAFVLSFKSENSSLHTRLEETIQNVVAQLAEDERLVDALKKAYTKRRKPLKATPDELEVLDELGVLELLEATPDKLEVLVSCFKTGKIFLHTRPGKAMQIVRAQLDATRLSESQPSRQQIIMRLSPDAAYVSA